MLLMELNGTISTEANLRTYIITCNGGVRLRYNILPSYIAAMSFS